MQWNLLIIRYIFTRRCKKLAYKCGEKLGKGTYVCKKCGSEKVLNDFTDALPPCSKCDNCEFDKIWWYTIKIVRIFGYERVIRN